MADLGIDELKVIRQYLYRLIKAMSEMNKKIDALATPADRVMLADVLNDKNKHDIPSRDDREYDWEPWPEDWREDR